MKSTYVGILGLLLMTIFSCAKKQEAGQPDDVTALQDFPKEWVLVSDLNPPDSINRNYAILVDSSNAFIGGITIKQNGDHWQMINSGFYYPGAYRIKNCKRTNEGEMVYYSFDLQREQDTTRLKLSVNFRHHPEDPAAMTSVFTCTTCDSNQDVELCEKTMIDRFPKKPLASVQYD